MAIARALVEHDVDDGQAEEPHYAALPGTPAAVKQMSWSDLQAVFAIEFANEIETVVSGEVGPVIRERLGGIGTEGRRVLREALDDVESVEKR